MRYGIELNIKEIQIEKIKEMLLSYEVKIKLDKTDKIIGNKIWCINYVQEFMNKVTYKIT